MPTTDFNCTTEEVLAISFGVARAVVPGLSDYFVTYICNLVYGPFLWSFFCKFSLHTPLYHKTVSYTFNFVLKIRQYFGNLVALICDLGHSLFSCQHTSRSSQFNINLSTVYEDNYEICTDRERRIDRQRFI